MIIIDSISKKSKIPKNISDTYTQRIYSVYSRYIRNVYAQSTLKNIRDLSVT